jgi:hypothetical protein
VSTTVTPQAPDDVLTLRPTAKKPGAFEIKLDPRITDPASTRVSFLI